MGQGAYGGRRGRVRGLGLATTAWAQGGPLSPVGPRWSGQHSAGALSSLALTRCTDFFALGHGVQRGGCEALLVARRRELAGGGGASECARREPGLWVDPQGSPSFLFFFLIAVFIFHHLHRRKARPKFLVS